MMAGPSSGHHFFGYNFSRANLDTAALMVVVFLLKLVEVAVPRLVCLPCVPSVDTIIKGAEVAYFLAGRCKPSVEEGIGDRLGQLMACGSSRGVGLHIAVWRRCARSLTKCRVAIRHVRINDGARRF